MFQTQILPHLAGCHLSLQIDIESKKLDGRNRGRSNHGPPKFPSSHENGRTSRIFFGSPLPAQKKKFGQTSESSPGQEKKFWSEFTVWPVEKKFGRIQTSGGRQPEKKILVGLQSAPPSQEKKFWSNFNVPPSQKNKKKIWSDFTVLPQPREKNSGRIHCGLLVSNLDSVWKP